MTIYPSDHILKSKIRQEYWKEVAKRNRQGLDTEIPYQEYDKIGEEVSNRLSELQETIKNWHWRTIPASMENSGSLMQWLDENCSSAYYWDYDRTSPGFDSKIAFESDEDAALFTLTHGG